MKLDPLDFNTLHEGLDTLQTTLRQSQKPAVYRALLKQIKSARSALDAIGTY